MIRRSTNQKTEMFEQEMNLLGSARTMAMRPRMVNPMCPEGIRSPQEEKERPSDGMCEITSTQLKVIRTQWHYSLGGLKVLPGRQCVAGPGRIVRHSQQARIT